MRALRLDARWPSDRPSLCGLDGASACGRGSAALVDDAGGDLDFAHANARRAGGAAREHRASAVSVGKQIDRVDRPRLADAIDPADALLEANRIPRQLEIDDEPAAALKVQAFGARIGGEQEVGRAARERVDGLAPFLRRLSAVRRRRVRHAADARLQSRRACRDTR